MTTTTDGPPRPADDPVTELLIQIRDELKQYRETIEAKRNIRGEALRIRGGEETLSERFPGPHAPSRAELKERLHRAKESMRAHLHFPDLISPALARLRASREEMEALLPRPARLHMINVDRYMRLAEAGLFDGERLELIRGVITTKEPQTGPHIAAMRELVDLLAPPQWFPPDLLAQHIRPICRAEYEQMVEALVVPGVCLDLLRGALVEIPAKSFPAMDALYLLETRLRIPPGRGVFLRRHFPLHVGDDAIIHPDLALIPSSHPAADPKPDVHLVVHVADQTLRLDRRVKLPLYAAGGAPECWIANLIEGVVEVYTQPTPDRYVGFRTYGPGETVSPLAFPDVAIEVAEIVGR